MLESNLIGSKDKHVNLIRNKPVEKLAMKIVQNLNIKVFLIFLIELITFCQTLPNHITVVNDKINLNQSDYNYILNQVKNQLLIKIQEIVNNDQELASTKYELCNMTFINNSEKQKADTEYLDIDLWLSNNSLDNYQLNGQYYDQQHARKRRSVSTPQFVKFLNKHNQNVPANEQNATESHEKQYTIETAVFIDRFLAAKFQNRMNDLKKLVLTIMHQVQLIYNYSSMKTKIKIVIVKYEVLNSASASPSTADGDIDKYLDNFCSWQSRRYRLQNRQHERWDHAIMLTGLDLFKDLGNGKKNKKVLGLAWVNGICKPNYSCTLNEGKSFEASFVIAHEMGHSLGILHDGKGNNCDGDKYLMSEKTGPGKVNWSPCSNFYIENFISRGHAKCLDDVAIPNLELDFKSNVLPGQLFTANHQCQLALGIQYQAYFSSKTPFNDICRELWCITGNWATPAHPALEGTQCSTAGQCYQGQCKTAIDLTQHSARSSVQSSGQNNLMSVQRNYAVPVNSTTSSKHENLLTDARLSRSRMKLLNRLEKSTTTVTQTEQSLSRKQLNTTRETYSNKKTNLEELNKSSFMEDVRSFLKTMTSNAEGFFNVFKFKIG